MLKFNLNDKVEIISTTQSGTVLARCEYARSNNNQYMVEHRDAQGDLVQRWYDEISLAAI